MAYCVKCGKEIKELFVTAYGKIRCDICYDDYLMTDKGKVDYFVGLVNGILSIEDYDADFLGYLSVCWRKYRNELGLTMQAIQEIEEKAKQLGLL